MRALCHWRQGQLHQNLQKASTILYDLICMTRKCETHARDFSRTLTQGNSKNEKLDKDTVEEDKSTDMERSTVGTKKKVPTVPPGSLLPDEQ